MTAILAAMALAWMPTPQTPAWMPIAGPDGATCPGGTLADGSVRPFANDDLTLTCVRIAVAEIGA